MPMFMEKIGAAYNRLRGHTAQTFVDMRPFAYSEEDWLENLACVEASRSASRTVRTITWFLLPTIGHAMGGNATIYRFAAYFAEQGAQNTFVYCGSPAFSEPDVRRFLKTTAMGAKSARICIGTDSATSFASIPACDVAIATQWSTAYPLLRFRKASSKYYLVQDYEPDFYPAGITRSLAEATYEFGFNGMLNSPSLTDRYEAAGNANMYFIPAIDRGRYAAAREREAEKVRLFFYARPDKPRSGFEFGLSVISILKREYGDRIEVVTAGRDWDPHKYGAEGLVTNLGLIRNLDDVATLYRSCPIGLFFVYTQGFPLAPAEYMATGGAVFTNRNPANQRFLRDGDTAISSGPSMVEAVQKLRKLIDAPYERERIGKNALQMIIALDRERNDGHDEAAVWRFLSKA